MCAFNMFNDFMNYYYLDFDVEQIYTSSALHVDYFSFNQHAIRLISVHLLKQNDYVAGRSKCE